MEILLGRISWIGVARLPKVGRDRAPINPGIVILSRGCRSLAVARLSLPTFLEEDLMISMLILQFLELGFLCACYLSGSRLLALVTCWLLLSVIEWEC